MILQVRLWSIIREKIKSYDNRYDYFGELSFSESKTDQSNFLYSVQTFDSISAMQRKKDRNKFSTLLPTFSFFYLLNNLHRFLLRFNHSQPPPS